MTYVHGSAAVIGLQMVPVLEPVVPREIAEPYAADLGVAFQLSNFIRDVGEDLQRGRVYLPLEDLAAFGVTREFTSSTAWWTGRSAGCWPSRWPAPASSTAAPRWACGCSHPTSRPCIETALALYGGILDEVEKADYAVLGQRVGVGPARRAAGRGARPGPRLVGPPDRLIGFARGPQR